MTMLSLDYKSRLPIYEQLYNGISRMAALGGLNADEQLPSVRTLAQELGVNPNTVQKAYQLLEHDGVIYSVPGKGSFISENAGTLSRQKKQAETKIQDAVHSALDCGMTRDEILDCTETAIKGGNAAS